MIILYTSCSALECAIWQIWHRKVRARDTRGKQKPYFVLKPIFELAIVIILSP